MARATRDRIVEAGATLFRRQGYAGTGMKAIAAEANAPFGSIYHFFPGGKDELTGDVIRAAARVYGELVPAFFDQTPNIAVATRKAFDGAAETLHASDYADACPIATVALEVASINEVLRIATADAFQLWLDLLADRYARGGLSDAKARELAMAFLMNLEGAFILARAFRDTSPLKVAGAAMFHAVENALAEIEPGAQQ